MGRINMKQPILILWKYRPPVIAVCAGIVLYMFLYSEIKINETAMYYTFSTIAQTLAGAFGILGAFVMYRLQNIKQLNSNIGKIIIESKSSTLPHLADILTPYIYQDWASFYENLNKRKDDDIKMNHAIEEIKERKTGGVLYRDYFYKCYLTDKDNVFHSLNVLKNNLRTKKDVIACIKITLIFTIIVISLSLIALPCCCELSHSLIWGRFLTAVAIVLSIGCLYSYAFLLFIALEIKGKWKKPLKN